MVIFTTIFLFIYLFFKIIYSFIYWNILTRAYSFITNKIIRSLNIVYTEKTMFLFFLHYAVSLHFADVIFRDFLIHDRFSHSCNKIQKVKKNDYLQYCYRHTISLYVLHCMYKRICHSNYGLWKVNVGYVVKRNNNIICLSYKRCLSFW